MNRTGSIYNIRQFGDPALRQQGRDVARFDRDLEQLVEMMFVMMDEADGVGLAATQIGIQKRLAVWRHPDTDERYVLVNPIIVEASEETTTASEGCLSVPGCSMDVERADRVVVQALDVNGVPYTREATGMLARILQHEIDHLGGHLIIDRTSPEERRRVMKLLREQLLEP